MSGFGFLQLTMMMSSLALAGIGPASAADPLPAYGANIAETSVSGISSGAAMAMQFHVAHSSIVKGAGVVAGAAYACAENSSSRATQNCMKPDADHPSPDAAHLKEITDDLVRSGAIDDVVNLRNSRVWLFSGQADQVVATPVMNIVRDYYALYLPTGDQIVYRKDLKAGHAMITEDYGSSCDFTGPPFIDNCRLDAAGAILKQIYGELNAPSAQPNDRYTEFDQREFFPDGDAHGHSMSDTGYAYVPPACASEVCRVHVVLHGCRQQAEAIEDSFYKHAGYNRWADTNRIIVLYPQTISRWGWGWPFYTFNFRWNPNACWDWWGYDSDDYHTKRGAQIRAIRGMVERLAGTSNH